MKSYSNDLRRKIVAAYETGDYSQDEIAELFGVCQKSVSNFVRRHDQTGTPDKLPRGGGRQAQLDEPARQVIRDLLKASNHLTLAQLCQQIDEKCKKRVSSPTMSRVLAALGLTRKKRCSTPLNVTPRESNRRVPSIK
jgi:transposase